MSHFWAGSQTGLGKILVINYKMKSVSIFKLGSLFTLAIQLYGSRLGLQSSLLWPLFNLPEWTKISCSFLFLSSHRTHATTA